MVAKKPIKKDWEDPKDVIVLDDRGREKRDDFDLGKEDQDLNADDDDGDMDQDFDFEDGSD